MTVELVLGLGALLMGAMIAMGPLPLHLGQVLDGQTEATRTGRRRRVGVGAACFYAWVLLLLAVFLGVLFVRYGGLT